MNATNDLLLFMVILIGLGLVWAATGGPEKAALKYEGETTSLSPTILGQTETQKETPSAHIADDSSQENSASMENGDKITILTNTSPYEGRVTIVKSNSGPRKKDADDEYIEIQASEENTTPIPITGWRVTSVISGTSLEIKEGVRLPKTELLFSESGISLDPGDHAIIGTGRSPIGVSFRTNVCTGYFEQFQDFSPTLRRECPRPKNESEITANIIRTFGNECIDFIERLQQCEMPLGALPPRFPPACTEFITTTINYNGCVENHRDDTDFYKNEWRIFLGRDKEIWRDKREIIRLLDSNSSIVDTFIY